MKFHQFVALASLTFASHSVNAAPKPTKPMPAPKAAPAKCDITLEGTDMMQYQIDGKKVDSITVPLSCKEFVVTLNFTGKLPKGVMGHDFVLTATADAKAVADEASKLGPVPKGYLPDANDMKKAPFNKILAKGDLLLGADGPKTEKITISTKKLKADGKYTFFCTFPGHFAMMQGVLKVVK